MLGKFGNLNMDVYESKLSMDYPIVRFPPPLSLLGVFDCAISLLHTIPNPFFFDLCLADLGGP